MNKPPFTEPHKEDAAQFFAGKIPACTLPGHHRYAGLHEWFVSVSADDTVVGYWYEPLNLWWDKQVMTYVTPSGVEFRYIPGAYDDGAFLKALLDGTIPPHPGEGLHTQPWHEYLYYPTRDAPYEKTSSWSEKLKAWEAPPA